MHIGTLFFIVIIIVLWFQIYYFCFLLFSLSAHDLAPYFAEKNQSNGELQLLKSRNPFVLPACLPCAVSSFPRLLFPCTVQPHCECWLTPGLFLHHCSLCVPYLNTLCPSAEHFSSSLRHMPIFYNHFYVIFYIKTSPKKFFLLSLLPFSLGLVIFSLEAFLVQSPQCWTWPTPVTPRQVGICQHHHGHLVTSFLLYWLRVHHPFLCSWHSSHFPGFSFSLLCSLYVFVFPRVQFSDFSHGYWLTMRSHLLCCFKYAGWMESLYGPWKFATSPKPFIISVDEVNTF